MNPTHKLYVPLKRSQRRMLVVAEMVCVVLTTAGFVVFGSSPIPLLLFGALIVPIAAAVFHTRLALSIQNIAQVNPRTLDERQRLARDHAFSLGLSIISVVLTVTWVYAMFAAMLDWWLPTSSQLWKVIWLPAMLTYGLPTAIIAWLEPDSLEE